MDTTSRADTKPTRSFVNRYLDPTDVLGEVLFGLIMVLAFTLGAGLVVEEGREATIKMLIGILGCNIAWGIIDGNMYIISCLFDRSRQARILESIQVAASEGEALGMIEEQLDHSLEPFTTESERLHIYRAVYTRLRGMAIEHSHLRKEDVYGAIACFWLVFISALPAVIPFLLFSDRIVALRVSNLLLLGMLFFVGYRVGKVAHSRPWVVGSVVLVAGLIMVGTVIALGG